MVMRFKGYLTRKEIELLEEASQRKIKPRKPAPMFICNECSHQWLYKTARCPLCSSQKLTIEKRKR